MVAGDSNNLTAFRFFTFDISRDTLTFAPNFRESISFYITEYYAKRW
ncbi:MAG: hypothetical protein K0R82_1577 [Flavipsychrobacter sp.]|jgi:hypothetical protein|nr:hypothetical protein [Flavipsychrobacter sp.]